MHRAAARARPSARALPRLPRAVLWGAAVLILLLVGWLWFRDSGLVGVKHVTVSGLTGPDASRITAQLEDAARDMTTLHVRKDQLESVVASYPVVKDLRVSTDFPHGLHITVIENRPVAAVVTDGTRVAVTGDGRLLRGVRTTSLPTVPLPAPPGGERVVDHNALEAVVALAAAPPELRARVQRAEVTRSAGLTLELRSGPELRFGGVDRVRAKWAAAVAVLSDPSSAGAVYLDLRYPERPAAGGLEDPASQAAPDAANAATPPGFSPST
jgi:cell division protein FtsQ